MSAGARLTIRCFAGERCRGGSSAVLELADSVAVEPPELGDEPG